MSKFKGDNQLHNIQGELISIKDTEENMLKNTELIQKAINGNKAAFEQLYMQSYRYVFFVVRQYIPDDETTYDVIQETFIKVFKGISSLRSPTAYYSWLTTIAKNTAKNFLRSKHNESSITEEEDYSEFLRQDQTQKDVELDIAAVLRELQPQDAELLSLVYYDGMRVTQIAKMRGVPAATVYTQLNRAKRNLKSQLAVHGIDKSVYSGDFVAMIATSIRNIIGTALLSVAIAQQILNGVVKGSSKKEIAVAKVIKQQQKKNVLKIASCIVAISMITTIITVVAILGLGKNMSNNHNSGTTSSNQSVTLSSPESNNTQQDSNTQQNGNTQTETSDNTHEPSSSENSSQGGTQDDTVVGSNQNPNSSDALDSSNNSSNTQSQPTTPPDDSTEVINVFGNNPNNVMTANQQLDQYDTGLVAKQGEWIYYVQQYVRIMKVKTDGSDAQVVFETSGYSYIECLNVIGDTIYYINGGIWSVKTDGTNRKQHTTKSAHNLLVRGTTGWFVELTKQTQHPYESRYNLYQIDFSTGDITTLVENGVGFGLKTVVDNKLIYANDIKIYSRDLSTDSQEVIFDVSAQEPFVNSDAKFDIEGMIMGSDHNMYIEIGVSNSNYGHITYKINLNQPNFVLETYDYFDRIYNYFDHNGGAFFTIRGLYFTFFDLQGNALCKEDENIHRYTGIYTFDDGYAYYFDENRTALYRMRPDGTGLKIY